MRFTVISFFAALALTLAAPLDSDVVGPPPEPTEDCLKLSKQCEDDTDCIHRLAVVQSACTTMTCQPQCRVAALNLYQNRQGRNLLRSDTTCVPGRAELEFCGFLPNSSPKHCNFAKLICEADLQCNSKWEVFVSECEAEASQGQCSDKCRRHLNATLATPAGAEFATCTCTDKEDSLCINLRDSILKACGAGAGSTTLPVAPPAPVSPKSKTTPPTPPKTTTTSAPAAASSPMALFAVLMTCFFARVQLL